MQSRRYSRNSVIMGTSLKFKYNSNLLLNVPEKQIDLFFIINLTNFMYSHQMIVFLMYSHQMVVFFMYSHQIIVLIKF